MVDKRAWHKELPTAKAKTRAIAMLSATHKFVQLVFFSVMSLYASFSLNACLLFVGHYMYTEVSPTSLPKGSKARLLSPRYPVTQGSCLQFWYHMYGRTIGTLNVYIRSFSWSQTKVWSKTGNDTNIWNVAQVSFSSRYRYQVFMFIAVE